MIPDSMYAFISITLTGFLVFAILRVHVFSQYPMAGRVFLIPHPAYARNNIASQSPHGIWAPVLQLSPSAQGFQKKHANASLPYIRLPKRFGFLGAVFFGWSADNRLPYIG